MIKVRMNDLAGNSRLRDEIATLYASDLQHRPFKRKTQVKHDGLIELYVPDEAVILHAKVHLPDYGFMWVSADNGGVGYRSGDEVDFIAECAISRVHEVEQYIKDNPADYSAKALSLLADARYLVNKAARDARKDMLYHMALANSLLAGELCVIEKAQQKILARKKREAFMFGCTSFNFEGKKDLETQRLFADVFNYTTLPFYLSRLEPEKGKPDYRQIDFLLEAYTEIGVQCKGHPLWWAHELHGMPTWTQNLSMQDGSLKKEIDRVIKRSVNRYKGKITIYDAINEAHDWCNAYHLTQDEEALMSKWCCDAIHEADPQTKAVINTCFMFGENVADGRVQFGPEFPRLMTPFTYLEKVMDLQTDFEVIGIQLYCPSRDMMAIDKLFDRYRVFGKPIHLTELGVPSRAADVPYGANEHDLYCLRYMYSGLWREMSWSQRLQADWLESFYTLAYARPEIEWLTWWGLNDPAYIPASGLLDEEKAPKESYFRLKAWQEKYHCR